MDNLNWQTLCALAIVLVAAAFLVRRVYGVVQGGEKPGCGTGGCGSCPTEAPSQQGGRELPLVSLELDDSENE